MAETKVHQITLENWNTFIKLVNKFDVSVPPALGYVYRGTSKKEYELTPSFHRYFGSLINDPELSLKPESLLKIEAIACKRFSSQAHLYVSAHIMSKTIGVFDWWVLMQHHHAPTRLLDWSESPYVAAYHACRENFDKDGAVWLLHVKYFGQRMKEIHNEKDVELPSGNTKINNYFIKPNTSQNVLFISTNLKTDRIVAQQGLFAACRNICGDQHKIICDTFPDGTYKDKTAFVQLVIPSHLKPEFIKKLHVMNITASSLFPGLDGLGDSVKELILLNALAEKVKLL